MGNETNVPEGCLYLQGSEQFALSYGPREQPVNAGSGTNRQMMVMRTRSCSGDKNPFRIAKGVLNSNASLGLFDIHRLR